MKETVKEYGGGLYELAVDEGLEEVLLEQTRVLRGILEPEYLHLLTTPGIPKTERTALASEALDGRVHPYLANFVGLMVERGSAYDIPACFEEYERRYLLPFGPLEEALEKCRTFGHAVQGEDGRWRLTPKGFLISNTIISDLLLIQDASEPLAKRR